MPFAPSAIVDPTVGLIIVGSQLELLRILYRDWKSRVRPLAFRWILTGMACLTPLILYGILVSCTRSLTRTPVASGWVSAWAVAFSLMWGLASCGAIALYFIYRRIVLRGKPPESFSPERRKLLETAGALVIAAPFGIIGFGGILERTNFLVKEVDVPISNLHPDLEGLSIVQLSDLHVSPYLSVRELGRAIDMANEVKPFLTVVTGDLISYEGDPIDATIRELGRLRAEHGVLGCLGNHEVYTQMEAHAQKESARYGVEFLRQQNKEIRRGNGILNVTGVDFQPFYHRDEYLVNADGLLRPDMPNILLSHNPDVFPAAAARGYDLTLAGHTHGGQVTVEILNQTANLAKFFTPYVAGLYRAGEKSCYVTAGIGTIGMPVRLGAPPEITLIRLRRA